MAQNIVTDLLEGFIGLLYPNVCACCSTGLMRGEKYICSHCMHELPVTNFYKELDNPVTQVFWGRVEVEHAMANYFFRKGNRVQKLIHQIKYQGQKEMGTVLGKEMGKSLADSYFKKTDVIVPVPLHPHKLRKRGYNQSEWIARGVAEMMGKPVDTKILVRHSSTNSQTRRKRFDRWENVDSGFGLTDAAVFAGKHILLIDDVITTGATLEACIHAIQVSQNAKVSVATLAIASQ